jgi:hypothetical protein
MFNGPNYNLSIMLTVRYFNQMSFNQISFNQMFFNQMSFEQMSLEKMSVGQTTLNAFFTLMFVFRRKNKENCKKTETLWPIP